MKLLKLINKHDFEISKELEEINVYYSKMIDKLTKENELLKKKIKKLEDKQ